MNSNYQSQYNSNNFNSKLTGKVNLDLVNSNSVDSLYKNNVSNFVKNFQPTNRFDLVKQNKDIKIINNEKIEQKENVLINKIKNQVNFDTSNNSFGTNNYLNNFVIKEVLYFLNLRKLKKQQQQKKVHIEIIP